MSPNIATHSDDRNTDEKSKSDKDDKFKIKAGIFLASVAGISAVIGFGSTVAAARKKDPSYFSKGMIGSLELSETGASLALRALGWGSVYAFTGCGLLFYSIWKLSGANNFSDFRVKMGSILPRIPKNDPPQGRTEFEGLTDLLTYLSTLRSTADHEKNYNNVPDENGLLFKKDEN